MTTNRIVPASRRCSREGSTAGKPERLTNSTRKAARPFAEANPTRRRSHVAIARCEVVGVHRPRFGGLPGGDGAAADGDGAARGAIADQQRGAERDERE